MEVDILTSWQYTRQGTPGYVLLQAGLLQVNHRHEAITLEATAALRDLVPDLQEAELLEVLRTLQIYVVATAWDHSKFLCGSDFNMDALNALRNRGVQEAGLGRLRSLIDRTPQGIHAAIWSEFAEDTFALPADAPLTLAAYSAGFTKRAYVETTAVGRTLLDMPLFLEPEIYVNVPLEATYQAAFRGVPRRWKTVLEGGER